MKPTDREIKANIAGSMVWSLMDAAAKSNDRKSYLHVVAESYFSDSPVEVDFAEKHGREIYSRLIEDSITYAHVSKAAANTPMMLAACCLVVHLLAIMQPNKEARSKIVSILRETAGDVEDMEVIFSEVWDHVAGEVGKMSSEMLADFMIRANREK